MLWADELPEYNLSVKGLGMGNAYTGHARGHDGIFYNPASLASLEGFQFRMMGLGVGLNGLDVYSEYKDIFDSADNDMATALNALYGQPIWARLDYQLSISTGPFIVGAYFRNNLGFTLQNPALPYLDAEFYSDMVLFGGAGVQLIPKIFEVGLIAKRITRYAGSGDITASTLAFLDSDVLEDMSRTGVAYGADFGAKLTLPGDWHPSAAFAWQDIGDTSFSFSETNPAPPTIKDRMNVALGLEREFMGIAKLRPALEYKMLNSSSSEVQIGKKIHAGIELELPAITLRGGFNQGYYTYGASFDFWIFQVDAATYAVELGEYVGQREDRRYILQLTADFGIDGTSGDWFNFSKSRRNRRALKQRR